MGLTTRRTIGTEDFMRRPMLFTDLETTGDSWDEGGEICEAGLVKVDPLTLAVIDERDIRFAVDNPYGRTEAELSYRGYNGFTFAAWMYALPKAEALRELNDFADGCVVWAWNVGFEMLWLERYYQVYGLDWSGDYHWFDLLTAGRVILDREFRSGALTRLSMSMVGQLLGLEAEPLPHRGLAGAKYEHQLYCRLLERAARTA